MLLIFRLLLNIFLVWLLATQFPSQFALAGGWKSVLIVGALVTALNLVLRPALALITFPLKLFLSLVAILLVNGIFVWLLVTLAGLIDPTLLQIHGFTGWVLVALFLGAGNWIMKVILK